MNKYLLLALCLFQNLIYGSITSNKIDIICGEFVGSSTMHAYENFSLKTRIFSGDGIIKSPNISVICDKFKFTGSIECEKKCLIYTKENFDISVIRKSGNGQFKIIISPYFFEQYNTELDIINTYFNYFCRKCVDLTSNDINRDVQEFLNISAMNFFDNKNTLHQLKIKIESEIAIIKRRLFQKYNLVELGLGLSTLSLSLGSLYGAYYFDKKGREAIDNVKICGLISGVSMYYAIKNFLSVPTHNKEKCEKLSMILERINDALATDKKLDIQVIDL